MLAIYSCKFWAFYALRPQTTNFFDSCFRSSYFCRVPFLCRIELPILSNLFSIRELPIESKPRLSSKEFPMWSRAFLSSSELPMRSKPRLFCSSEVPRTRFRSSELAISPNGLFSSNALPISSNALFCSYVLIGLLQHRASKSTI